MKEGNLVKRHLQCRCDVFNMAKYCMIYTFVFGLMAHLYAFANFTISHDSLVGFHSLDETKVEIGAVWSSIIQIYYQRHCHIALDCRHHCPIIRGYIQYPNL